jgi:hypothetical protein
MTHSKRMLALLLSCAFSATLVAPASAAGHKAQLKQGTEKRLPALKVLDRFVTKDGRKVTLYAGDMALVQSRKGAQSVRYLPDVAMSTHGLFPPDRSVELASVNKPVLSQHPYIDGEVLVVLRTGAGLPDSLTLSKADLATNYRYADSAELNATLRELGVNHVKRLLTGLGEARLAAMRAQARGGASLLPLENTYALQITRGSVHAAVTRLRTVAAVLDAEPAMRISPLDTYPVNITTADRYRARTLAASGHDRLTSGRIGAFSVAQSGIPTNYAVAYSAQSMLNAPGVNAIAAYDEIERHFHQLPGAGEIITNVSVGDVTDATTATNVNSPCYVYASNDGPTVSLIGGQHYLEMPSLPAIPTYVANDAGVLDGSGIACGEDPVLAEVGLDFSVMAALPHQMQQGSEIGSGYSDLLGIAPGASYRLVVPQTTATFLQTVAQGPTNADLVGALLGAVNQSPAPNVINMSIGFGFDSYGFPTRFIEEDPLLQAAVEYAVAKGIVVCIASGDGLRMYTNAAIGPSGGTVPLDTVTSGETNILDDEMSTTPSLVTDSGEIAVGGTTLDDVTSAPPDQAQFARYRDQLTFPEVRWNGLGSLASAYGTRVNISAPADNIVSDNLDGSSLEGGTSASSPEVAAGAAIALQVARLTGKPFTSPQAVRSFLVSTARAVPTVPQTDVKINVGPQLDVANEVETLLRDSHATLRPVLNRVAIAQRYTKEGEFLFTTDTDPTAIDLDDVHAYVGAQAGSSAFQPITIAPDWEELPSGTSFRVFLQNAPHKLLGTGPWARLYPKDLLADEHLPFYSTQTRTVSLTYQAYQGFKVLASGSVALTFLPNQKILQGVGPAPVVPPVVTGSTIPVSYDISDVNPAALSNPSLIVSYPGRMSTWTSGDPGYKAVYSVPISQLKGTVQVPVSALKGDGIYGVAVQINTWPNLAAPQTIGLTAAPPVATTWAYTRVASVGAKRPAAPILSAQNSAPFPAESGHTIDVSYNAPFQVQWSVANVPHADGGILEISAAGPSLFSNYNMFNNPNGSVLDDNGVDTGSVYKLALNGSSGTTTVNPWSSILASEYYTVRVLPTVGGQVVGEAGDVSTIESHGALADDGGSLDGGFVVNPNGNDGVLTSNQLDSANRVDSSMETFDLQTMQTTYDISSISTDAGVNAYVGGGATVPVYDLNGFDMDATGNAVTVGTDTTQWDLYPNGAASSLEYVPNVQRTYAYANCEFCDAVNPPTAYPFLAEATSGSTNYMLSYTSQPSTMTLTPFTTGTAPTPGTALPMPYPLLRGNTIDGSACNGLTIVPSGNGGIAFSSFYGIDSGSIYVQPLSLTPGASENTFPAISTPGSGTTCGLANQDGDVGLAVESPVPGSQGQTVLYIITNNTTPNPISLQGYVPVAITNFTGEYYNGFVVVSALAQDYLTNFNASSTINIVPDSAPPSGIWVYYYGPTENYGVLPTIAANNRYAANGTNGLVYLLGAQGYEVAPYLTGL